jgi:hypothetical protein
LLDVCYDPDCDQILQRSETARCAIRDRCAAAKQDLYPIERPSSVSGKIAAD